MIFVFLSFALLPLAIVGYLLFHPPPIGYEDESGFHYGSRDETVAKGHDAASGCGQIDAGSQ